MYVFGYIEDGKMKRRKQERKKERREERGKKETKRWGR